MAKPVEADSSHCVPHSVVPHRDVLAPPAAPRAAHPDQRPVAR